MFGMDGVEVVSVLCGLLFVMWNSKRAQLITIYSYASNKPVSSIQTSRAISTPEKTLRAYRGFIRRNIRPCKKAKQFKFFDVGPSTKRSDQAGMERETNPYILTDTRPLYFTILELRNLGSICSV